MKKLILGMAIGAFMMGGSSCRKCYECTVETEDGTVSRTICGRKKDIDPLISHLESDTDGNGPWTCK